ncbi:MAG: F0F1 ATP synthase subunit epsilon [Pseudomonadota bacterium]
MAEFNFELVSPERLLMSANIEHVVLPGIEGQLGVMSGYLPSIVMLKPGMISVLSGNSVTHKIYVRGGFADINAQEVTVLAEHAMDIETASKDDIAAEISVAEQNLKEANDEDAYFIAQSALDALRSI